MTADLPGGRGSWPRASRNSGDEGGVSPPQFCNEDVVICDTWGVTIGLMDDGFALSPRTAVELRTRGRERALAALARDQHGVARRGHLLALGFDDKAIGRRIAKGQLGVVHRGVYSVGLIFRYSGVVIDVTSPRRRHSRPGIRMHFAVLPSDETVIEDGIRVTTPARTIFDLAATEPPNRLGRAIHEADVRRLLDATGLRALMDRYPGHRAAGRGDPRLAALDEPAQPHPAGGASPRAGSRGARGRRALGSTRCGAGAWRERRR